MSQGGSPNVLRSHLRHLTTLKVSPGQNLSPSYAQHKLLRIFGVLTLMHGKMNRLKYGYLVREMFVIH